VSFLQPLGIPRHADPVVPQNFDQVTALAAKNVKIAGVRVAPQPLLDLDRRLFMPRRISV
jgi:hypothetical protein